MQAIKAVVVGDVGVGKSTLLLTYSTNTFPGKQVPVIPVSFQDSMMVDCKPVRLEVWDTASQEVYDRLRPLSYSSTDIFILTYSVLNPSSLEHIQTKWLPEVRHHCPGVPVILVGTKKDQRDLIQEEVVSGRTEEEREEEETITPVVTYEQGNQMAKRIEATKFVECSSFTRLGLKQVFDETARVVMELRTKDCSKMDRIRKVNNTKCIIS